MRVLDRRGRSGDRVGLAERLRELGHDRSDRRETVSERSRLPWPILPTSTSSTSTCRGIDGLAAAAWLTDAGLRRPIVVVTGIDDADVIERSIASGVSAYLTKPVDTRELEAAVGLAAARHAELQALEDDAAQARQEARGAQDHRARKGPADVGAPALGGRRLPPAPAHRARA